jgi:hypothetical protein
MRVERPNPDEVWIGVDQRAALGSIPTDWNSDRRERYLLRLDVERPLSVDRRVWALETGRGGSRVALSVLDQEAPERVQSIWFPYEVEGEPRLLGYDIADDVFLSGLSNCGYTDAEKAALRPRWAARLNRFHLLDQVDAASEFKALTEARVPEHAPFFIFGLYLLSA